ncbi:MAG: hypothetical protein H6R15_4455 [Proteobacteria bacterium]|nr:hypothetical protein [Pseudomonadota bacterium]
MTPIESLSSVFASDNSAKQPARERRSDQDRRLQDFGPPEGLAERRVRAERRFPEVCFTEVDEHIEIPPVQ